MANSSPDVCLNEVLDEAFGGQTWYVGLIEDTSFTGFAAGDTMASHTGWTESTAYDEASRPAVSFGSAASKQITNGTTVDFTINASKTIKGFFLTTDNTKGGSAGILGPCVLFSSGDRAVVDDDVIKVTVTLEAEDTNT